MEKTRKIGLDRNEISKAIQDLKSMKKEISSLPDDIEDILDQAVSYCQSLTPISDKNGNHLRYNTYWEKTSTGYRIVQEGDYIAYVEFGTGVRGKNNSYEDKDILGAIGWEYGVGKHIFTTKDGRNGWFYPTGEEYISKTGNRSQVYKFTEGQPANMQMYKTALWLEEKLGQRINLVIDKAVNKWYG